MVHLRHGSATPAADVFFSLTSRVWSYFYQWCCRCACPPHESLRPAALAAPLPRRRRIREEVSCLYLTLCLVSRPRRIANAVDVSGRIASPSDWMGCKSMSRSWNGKMVMRWRGRQTALVVVRLLPPSLCACAYRSSAFSQCGSWELPSPAYSSPRIPSIPALPAPNVTELVMVSLASTLPEVHLLPSVPQHHRHPTVLALVLKDANIKYAASGKVASASRDAASQSRAAMIASALAQDMQFGENSVVRTRTYTSWLAMHIDFRTDPVPTLECMSPHLYRRLHVLTGTPRVIFLFPGRRSSRPS
jgi:hypothetical protein